MCLGRWKVCIGRRRERSDSRGPTEHVKGERLSGPPLPDAVASTSFQPTPPLVPVSKPKPALRTPPAAQQPRASTPSAPPKKKQVQATKVDIQTWEDDTLTQIFKVTLKRSVAERSNYDTVWLKGLEAELASEGYPSTMNISGDLADRLLIARLEVDPRAMSDDLDYAPVLASLPPQMTVLEYLSGCWKRHNSAKTNLLKKNPVNELQQASALLEKTRDLIISYVGLTLQEPEMFPQPIGREHGAPELVGLLLSLFAPSTPFATAASPNHVLARAEVEPFLQDIARRFEPGNEIDGILGPVVRLLLFHPSLFRSEGLAGGNSSWRGVVGGVEALVSVKSIAVMFTRLDEWNPSHATASTFETVTLMGPLCRLGVFSREWPSIAQSYFSEPTKRSRNDVEISTDILRGTVKTLQSSLFRIFNALIRASLESREAVLEYFAAAVKLNVKRAGMQVDPQTVASDSFVVNLQSILLRFAEPFLDSRYSKMDRVDPLYFAVSDRIDVREETCIKATSEEAAQWAEANKGNAPTPNFISDIFYLCNAMGHYGYLRTTQTYDGFAKHHDELQRRHDMINGDGSWIGSPFRAWTQAALNQIKMEVEKIQAHLFAFRVQLLEPDFILRYIAFTNFVSTWLIRRADPKGLHPTPLVELPLPQEVPMSFRVLPEYILEDVVEFFLFVTRHSPDRLDPSGKDELLVFALTFLTSTWYIRNPFLKAKVGEAVSCGVLPFGNEPNGILGTTLNRHPSALKHLIPALTHFYIEVEQTGASSQFYDKFNARQNIAYILKAIWSNPSHRQALNAEARNVEKFVRFVNLMINDVTYLMDESLGELEQIHNIQIEMCDQAAWAARPVQYRHEREGTLRGLERLASSYIILGKSTVGLLRDFTAETKAPFMMPEIVDKLAAMLDYNLEALVGPKCGKLRVKEPEKYHFNPRELLSNILQVYLNLSDREEFACAVANDERSYKKELFDMAINRARKMTLKSETELKQMSLFAIRVEKAKAVIKAEEDLGEVPEEFLDPLMFTLMRDPVILPSSRTIVDRATIKSHLLSDAKDPFNRIPLTINEVIPDVELKARIDAFVAERRTRRVKSAMLPEDMVMD